jgi:hypothetical protein
VSLQGHSASAHIALEETNGAISAAIIDNWKWRARKDLFRTIEDSSKKKFKLKGVSTETCGFATYCTYWTKG